MKHNSCELHGDGGDTEFGYPSPPELQAACGADRTFCSASGPSTSHCSSRIESCSFGKAAARTAANALRTLWTIGCNSAALGMKTAVRAFSGANLRWHCGPWLRLGIFSVTLHRHMWQQNGPISARSWECTRNWQVGFAHFSCLCRPRAPLASPNCECMCEMVFPTAASISKPDAACPAGDVTVCPRGGRSAGPWELPPGVKLLGMPTGSGKTPADAEELGSQA